VTAPKVVPATAIDYIDQYSVMAVSEMKRTGIPASITLAQGIIESDMGRSRLARDGNNHFGIKCHNNWTGATIRHDDDRRNECFRKYRNAEESFRDHSDFLVNTPRYRSLFDLASDDYKGWARGLKKAGYATNPDYANMLIRKVEEYGLARFDSGRFVKEPAKGNFNKAYNEELTDSKQPEVNLQKETARVSQSPTVREENRVQYIIVTPGETLSMIEEKHKLLSWELAKYNELPEDFEPEAGQRLYLQPKRDRAEAGKEYHTVKEGESLFSISQLYAVKRSRLMLYNRLKEGEEPVAGTRIWLRSVRPLD
jgi:LysM repeat protein